MGTRSALSLFNIAKILYSKTDKVIGMHGVSTPRAVQSGTKHDSPSFGLSTHPAIEDKQDNTSDDAIDGKAAKTVTCHKAQ